MLKLTSRRISLYNIKQKFDVQNVFRETSLVNSLKYDNQYKVIRQYTHIAQQSYECSRLPANVFDLSPHVILSRCYSSSASGSKNDQKNHPPRAPILPSMMKVPFMHPISGIPFFIPILNWFAHNYIIKPIEVDFSIEEFNRGAKEALIVVSNHLADQDYNTLYKLDLVTPDALNALRDNINQMTKLQRNHIAVDREDTIQVYPYQVKTSYDEHKQPFLELTVIFRIQKKCNIESEESNDM